jgi:hypothetical protein
MAITLNPQPAGNTTWIQEGGLPTTILLLYMLSLDKAMRSLIAGTGSVGTLINATSDASAAAAGVPVNGLYRNNAVVQIRLK